MTRVQGFMLVFHSKQIHTSPGENASARLGALKMVESAGDQPARAPSLQHLAQRLNYCQLEVLLNMNNIGTHKNMWPT